ncbi:hypothetical protein [Rodentibacter haemolyticus]|uniref:Uncharacterized protein n=1 Tax=Rodentibacter haemolyticus TaxID=2778911 RepID=A0ABX6UVT4_9PAST|nr:hypothetical protein [Rodentibacter haemolyticus]QPB42188.1 hypothetical protein IHV77_09765 [Rodentibacter haemolyticus]
MYFEPRNDIIINRFEIDRTFAQFQAENLNQFEQWLLSGAINPQHALEIIEKYYTNMPF